MKTDRTKTPNTADNAAKPWLEPLDSAESCIADIRKILGGEPLQSPDGPDEYYGSADDVIELFRVIYDDLARVQSDIVLTGFPRHNLYRRDESSHLCITVNGKRITDDPPALEYKIRPGQWTSTVRTILHHEYGHIDRAPVHYELIDRFLEGKNGIYSPESFGGWAITSENIKAAVAKAQTWLQQATSEHIASAVENLDTVMVNILMDAGVRHDNSAQLHLVASYIGDAHQKYLGRERGQILKLLLDDGMDPNLAAKVNGHPAKLLHILCAGKAGPRDIATLLAAGAYSGINKPDQDGNTPLLCYAARPDDKEQPDYRPNMTGFNLLLKYGADITARNSRGESVTELVAWKGPSPRYKKGRAQMVERLVAKGAPPPA